MRSAISDGWLPWCSTPAGNLLYPQQKNREGSRPRDQKSRDQKPTHALLYVPSASASRRACRYEAISEPTRKMSRTISMVLKVLLRCICSPFLLFSQATLSPSIHHRASSLTGRFWALLSVPTILDPGHRYATNENVRPPRSQRTESASTDDLYRKEWHARAELQPPVQGPLPSDTRY